MWRLDVRTADVWTVITDWECELKYKRSVERRINSLAAEISQARERNTHNDQIRKITRE